MNGKMTRWFKVLSIDGGGIRGLIPARVLEHIEAKVKEEHGKRLIDVFDLVVGTSTGGIIALGLALPIKPGCGIPYSAGDLVRFYLSKGRDIFPHSWLRWLRSFVWGPKYKS
jgi:uncharacterized protein